MEADMGAIPCVVFDLDSTIANTFHRQWMVPLILAGGEEAPTWDDYSILCAEDTPIEGVVTLMRILSAEAGMLIFIVTGRSAAARDLTHEWLAKHKIPYDALLMRAAGDRTPNGVFKVAMIDQIRKGGYDPVLALEDWPQAGEYINEHTRVPVVLVNANYPADALHQNENSRGV
jgi:hypothetical protein